MNALVIIFMSINYSYEGSLFNLIIFLVKQYKYWDEIRISDLLIDGTYFMIIELFSNII